MKHADFLPNSPSSSSTLHNLPIGLVVLACTLPGTIRTENLRKTPSSPLSLPRHTLPSQNRHPLQILCKNSGFALNFEGKNERKNSPSGLFFRPLSPKTGEKRAENHKQALRIVHFVVFLTSWLPTDATISRRKTQNQHFSAQLFRRCRSKTEDFEQPKVMWKRVGSIIRFCYNENGTLGLDSTCFATGKCIEYICCLLNSPMGHYMLRNSPTTGTGDLLISVQAIEPIMVPRIDEDKRLWFKSQLSNLCSVDEGKISEIIFDLYGLSEEERCYIVSNYA